MRKALGAVFVVCFVIVLGVCVRWISIDARSRGKSPSLVCLLVAMSFPLGLILWLLVRPAPLHAVTHRPSGT